MSEKRIMLTTPEMDSVIDQIVASRPDGPTKEQVLKRAEVVMRYLERQKSVQSEPTEQGDNNE